MFFVASFVIWDNKNAEKVFVVVFLIWLMLFDGTRWETGTDWVSYYDFFISGDNEHMGMSYALLNYFFRQFTESYSVLTLSLAIVLYAIIGFFLLKYSPRGLISIVTYFCTMNGIMGCNRQLIAMAICILSIYFLIERKIYPFLLMILIAVSFHFTALVFVFAYFFYDKYLSSLTVILSLIVAFLVGYFKLVNNIPFADYLLIIDSMSQGTDYSSYLNNYDDSLTLWGTVKRFVFVVFALCSRKYIISRDYNFFLNMYIISCIIYLVFNGSVLQLVAGRGALYYNVFECIIIAFIFSNLPIPKITLRVAWSGLFLFYFYLMWRDMNNYINLIGEDVFNPYGSALF